jgi:hypothetical protein
MKLISVYGMDDISTENNRNAGVLIMDTNRISPDSKNPDTVEKIYYKFYTNGKITYGTAKNSYNVQRIKPMNGHWREFENLFQKVISREEQIKK